MIDTSFDELGASTRALFLATANMWFHRPTSLNSLPSYLLANLQMIDAPYNQRSLKSVNISLKWVLQPKVRILYKFMSFYAIFSLNSFCTQALDFDYFIDVVKIKK